MHALVIGGGIIGLSTAYYLQEDGWEVTVVEKGDLSDNCSFGNMGYLSPSHFVPLAAPGMVEKGVLWMFNQKSPFYVRPLPSLDLIDWGLKFMRASNRAHANRSARPLVDLLLFSKRLFQGWAAGGELDFNLAERGCIMYYQTEKAEKEELENARKAEDLGLQVEVLGREQVQTIEPELKPDVRGGVLFKDDAHLYPNALMQQLPALLEKRGVRILRNSEVTGFERQNGRIGAVQYQQTGSTDCQALQPELVVLAAGSWSPRLARLAAESIPLMPGKGYSMTLEKPGKKLHYPCILLEAKVALTPWPDRLRIGSTMEIGPINDRILFPRVQGILEAVPRFLPGYLDDPVFRELADLEKLKAQLRRKVWFGFRPVSADGLPYIGFARQNKNLIIATGHAMLGLSLGAGTGKLVAELAGGKPASVPVEAFDPNRY
ncbi:MAG: FAD-dependent oxidoreductase [Saprospirales bacterium]|nr:FAD-dependent oxidoreductase [Saprospirales bacterium]MBK8920655.1 FAD-dependent oxidoreductase [Saprospirales bacterium]